MRRSTTLGRSRLTKEGKICFTSLDDGTVYAVYLADEGETEPPTKVWLTGFTPKAGSQLQLLGSSVRLTWEHIGKGVLIDIPDTVRKKALGKYAWTIKIAQLPELSQQTIPIARFHLCGVYSNWQVEGRGRRDAAQQSRNQIMCLIVNGFAA